MEHDISENAHGALSKEEAVALLKYMEHHNAHHAEELLETIPALPDGAANAIREAADLLRQSAEKIEIAIKEAEA